jgi:hypothetical protein
MRSNYSIIGCAIDLDGLSLIRFDLIGTRFKILETRSILGKTSFAAILNQIEELAVINNEPVYRMDLLGHFSEPLKSFILNNHKSPHILRAKKTSQTDTEELILNMQNILSEKRITVEVRDELALAALNQIKSITKQNLKDVYANNQSLDQVLEAMLFSVGFLESQLIKHKII